MPKLTYQYAGIDYDSMDALKRFAQAEGLTTLASIEDTPFSEHPQARGESAHVMDIGSSYLATVQEGLGTKSLIADEMKKITGKTYYDSLAQDTVAMIINDLITVGARPLTLMAYWAVGDKSWFDDSQRMKDLVTGWATACKRAGVVWGGGETCTIPGIIEKGIIDLAGSCTGLIEPKSRLTIGESVSEGDHILLLESSGIHSNGVTLARKIIESLPKKYRTKLTDDEYVGDSLLAPTLLYSKLVQELFTHHIAINYMVNITGHGWRKLMRLKKPFTYHIHSLPPVPEVLKFLTDQGQLEEKEAYGNFNMGAGFALFVAKKDIADISNIARSFNIKSYDAGVIKSGDRQVIIEPKNIVFTSESLAVRN